MWVYVLFFQAKKDRKFYRQARLKGVRGWTITDLLTTQLWGFQQSIFKTASRGIFVKKQEYGRAIGSHLGKPIYESFKDQGVIYIFDRVAQCDAEGCPLDQVKQGELLVNPGLIYRQAS